MEYITRWNIGDIAYIKCDDESIPRESNKCQVVNVQHLKTLYGEVVTYGVNILEIDTYHEFNESELEDF